MFCKSLVSYISNQELVIAHNVTIIICFIKFHVMIIKIKGAERISFQTEVTRRTTTNLITNIYFWIKIFIFRHNYYKFISFNLLTQHIYYGYKLLTIHAIDVAAFLLLAGLGRSLFFNIPAQVYPIRKVSHNKL